MKNNTVPSAPAVSSYEQSALDFLAKHGIHFRATLAKTQKSPNWEPHGLHYRVTLSRGKTTTSIIDPRGPAIHASKNGKTITERSARLVFDFWNSVRAKEKGETPSAYDVLSCISGDVHCPETFADFCSEYGYDEDSRAALATFKRCAAFARRLRAFFSEVEIEGLSEIQ